jgi:hypothetical protein
MYIYIYKYYVSIKIFKKEKSHLNKKSCSCHSGICQGKHQTLKLNSPTMGPCLQKSTHFWGRNIFDREIMHHISAGTVELRPRAQSKENVLNAQHPRMNRTRKERYHIGPTLSKGYVAPLQSQGDLSPGSALPCGENC